MNDAPRMLPFTIIDTMTTTHFTGNATPTFVLDEERPWPSESALQRIANQMNHSETAFVRRTEDNPQLFLVRWFTAFAEEFLCGHGLLAAAIGLHTTYGGSDFSFITSRGVPLSCVQSPVPTSSPSVFSFILTFPAVPDDPRLVPDSMYKERFAAALKLPVEAVIGLSQNELRDVNIELDPSVDFSAKNMFIDAVALLDASPPGTRSQVITSAWSLDPEVDFAKRVFAYGLEDQATGSTYCSLGPMWAARTGKAVLKTLQPSARVGRAVLTVSEKEVMCECSGLVTVRGSVVDPDSI